MKTEEFDVQVSVVVEPIKTSGEERIDAELLEAQAEVERDCLVAVDYENSYSTCGDERARIGLTGGSTEVQPRPSVFGGSDIHALAIGELTGAIPANITTGKERLRWAKQTINAARIKSGGHVKCAANGGFNTWMQIIADNPDAVADYAKKNMSEDEYDQSAMDEVVAYANAVVASGRYADWHEGILAEVITEEGSETEAGEAIELLVDAPHEALKAVRQKRDGMTIDQTKLYHESVLGKGSFNVDDAYAARIEAAVTSGPDAAHLMKVAAHAREAIIAAVAAVVPNKELYQDVIR